MFELYTVASRDLPDVINFKVLASMIQGLESSLEDCDNEDDKEDLKHDIRVLNDFMAEIEKYIGRGDDLISEDAFYDYARERIQESTPELRDLPPIITGAIDWQQVVNEYKMDFTEFELDGNQYYTI